MRGRWYPLLLLLVIYPVGLQAQDDLITDLSKRHYLLDNWYLHPKEIENLDKQRPDFSQIKFNQENGWYLIDLTEKNIHKKHYIFLTHFKEDEKVHGFEAAMINRAQYMCRIRRPLSCSIILK